MGWRERERTRGDGERDSVISHIFEVAAQTHAHTPPFALPRTAQRKNPRGKKIRIKCIKKGIDHPPACEMNHLASRQFPASNSSS
jgi:hypothetical protein